MLDGVTNCAVVNWGFTAVDALCRAMNYYTGGTCACTSSEAARRTAAAAGPEEIRTGWPRREWAKSNFLFETRVRAYEIRFIVLLAWSGCCGDGWRGVSGNLGEEIRCRVNA